MSLLSLPRGSAIHLVGIGGAGMSSLALILRAAGYQVSGSDLADSVVGMIEARTSTAADVAAFKAQDRMLAALLEIGTGTRH